MKYLLLLYREEPIEVAPEAVAAFRNFLGDARQFGTPRGGAALQSPSKTKVVSVRDGRTLVTDGPFADTKEQLAGFVLYDCGDREAAVRIAERLPFAAQSRVEIRPIAEFGGQS